MHAGIPKCTPESRNARRNPELVRGGWGVWKLNLLPWPYFAVTPKGANDDRAQVEDAEVSSLSGLGGEILLCV